MTPTEAQQAVDRAWEGGFFADCMQYVFEYGPNGRRQVLHRRRTYRAFRLKLADLLGRGPGAVGVVVKPCWYLERHPAPKDFRQFIASGPPTVQWACWVQVRR